MNSAIIDLISANRKIFKQGTNRNVMNFKNDLNDYFLFGIIIIFFALSAIDINRPVTAGHHGFNTGQNMHMANNYNKVGYGLLGARWNIADTAETGKEKYAYYTHHPAGSFLTYGIVFSIFGGTIIVGRITSITIAAITLILFYYLIRTNSNKQIARYSTLTLMIIPVFFYYRDMVAVEFLILAFTLIISIFYMKWLHTKNSKYILPIFLFTFLGLFTDWPMYFMGIPIWLHCLIYFKGPNKKLFLILYPVVFVLAFGAFMSHVYLLTGSFNGETDNEAGNLKKAFLFRTNQNEDSKSYGITIKGIFKRFWNTSNETHLSPVILWTTMLAVLAIAYLNFNKRKNTLSDNQNLIFENFMMFSLLNGFIFIFVFSNSFWIHTHEYIINFTPFAAYLCISFLSKLKVNFLNKEIKNITLIVFIAILLFFSYDIYKKTREQAEPLYSFLHDHPENVIVAYGVGKQGFQEMIYLNARQVLEIRDLSTFNSTDLSAYSYVITHSSTDKELYEFLKNKYNSTNSTKLEANQREVFYLK